MKRTITVLMAMIFLCVFLGIESYASCVKKCSASAVLKYTYKEKGNENRRKESIVIEQFITEGRYGGDCNLPHNRQKARKRARDEAEKVLNDKYKGKGRAQVAALCQKVPASIKQKADWFQVDGLKIRLVILRAAGGPDLLNPLNKEFTLPSASKAKFTCNGSTPVIDNDGHSPPTATGNKNEVGFDRPGADYRNFWLQGSHYLECKRACLSDPACKAWTCVKPGVQGAKAKCWLKNRVPAKVRNTNCVSGVR